VTPRLLLCAALAGATPLSAQEPDTARPAVDSVIVAPDVPVTAVPVEGDTTPRQPMSPRGAFIRSMILPGWGQAAFDHHFRGGVYFAGWAGNWFMNFRNAVRLDDARSRFELRESQLRDSLIFSPPAPGAPPNPDSMRAVLDSTNLLDETVRNDTGTGGADDLRKLVRAREQQREDWIAWTIFWILASGVDGYVTAHLSDFPATIDVDPGRDGSLTLRVEVPFGPGGPPGRRRP
jgi:Family of unknown function (DUF5683)